MKSDTPAVPAPASRSGEDHAAAKESAERYLTASQPVFWITRLAECYIAYAALLSRDSGEAVKRARAWQTAKLKRLTLEGGNETADALAADVLALSASTARLTEDNKRLREALERDVVEFWEAHAQFGADVKALAWVREHQALLDGLSPTASPPEGRTTDAIETAAKLLCRTPPICKPFPCQGCIDDAGAALTNLAAGQAGGGRHGSQSQVRQRIARSSICGSLKAMSGDVGGAMREDGPAGGTSTATRRPMQRTTSQCHHCAAKPPLTGRRSR